MHAAGGISPCGALFPFLGRLGDSPVFARFLAFLASLVAPLGHAATAAVQGVRSAGQAASIAVREAVDMLWDDLMPARKAVRVAGKGASALGRGAAIAGAGTAIAAGTAVEAVGGTVGRTLGAMLPTPPVTAKSLADAAVANDDARRGPAAVPALAPARAPVAPLSPGLRWLAPEKHAELVQESARLWLKRDRAALRALPPIDLSVIQWMGTLGESELRLIKHLPAERLEAHILAREPGDRNGALRPVPSYVEKLRPVLSLEETLHRAGYTAEEARPFLENEAARLAASDAEERRWKARQEHAADPAPGPIPPLRPSFGR